jgi:hypothetical protein
MAAFTMGLRPAAFPVGLKTSRSSHVFLVRNRFKVVRIDAGGVATQVVKLKPRRDGTPSLLIAEAMRSHNDTVYIEASVTSVVEFS